MISSILGLYMFNMLDNNIEGLLKSSVKGEVYEADLGMLGKALNKYTKGKIPANLGLVGKVGIKSQLAKTALSGVSHWLFNPYVAVGKAVAGAAIDYRKGELDREYQNNIMKTGTDDDFYRMDTRYQGVSNMMFQNMEMANRTIAEVMNSGNMASDILESVLSR